jgi:hypothetical protein
MSNVENDSFDDDDIIDYENESDNNTENENEIKEKNNIVQTLKNEKDTLPTNYDTNNSIKNKTKSQKIFNSKSKKKEIGKGKIVKKNLNEKFRPSSNSPNTRTTQKSVFTRLSEQMFEKLLKNKGMENVYNYESFTNENFLTNYSNKFDAKNKKLRKDFLSRNVKEVERKKLLNNKNMTNPNKNLTSTEPKKKEVMNKTQLDSFLEKQKNYNDKKKQDIESLKKKIETERTSKIRNIPLTNSNSNKIILLKSANYNSNKDTFTRLYDGYTKNEQKNLVNTKPRSPSNNQKQISKIFNKLYDDSKMYKSKLEEKRKVIYKNEYKLIVNPNSNDMIGQQLLKKYESEINNYFNKKAEDNFKLNFNEYLLLLGKIGFTIKDYSNLADFTNEIEKEFQLSKEGWKILTESKKFEQEKNIDSHKFLLFLLSVLRLYNGDNNTQLMKKNFQFINKDIDIKPKITDKIKIDFRLFSDNFINSLIKREKISRSTMSIIENKEKDLTFKPKINHQSFYENNSEKHTSIVKNYDLFRQKREKYLENERKKEEKEEMKECTFFPNNQNLQKNRSVSGGFSERLYMKRKKNNENTKSMKENEEVIKNVFSPNLTPYNSKMFEHNPLINDKSLTKKYEELENNRKQKKITKYLVSKGISNSIKNRNDDDLLREIEINEDSTRSFKFDNEYGNYKNTFNKFEKKNLDNQKRKVRYIFEINIDNKQKKLILHKTDNMEREVEKFCYENDLEPESKYKIIEAIKEKFNF